MSSSPLLADLNWMNFIIPGAGIFVTAVIVVLGYFLTRERKKPVNVAPVKEKRSRQEEDPFVHGSQSDRRQSSRRSGSPVRVIVQDPTNEKVMIEGIVTDRSMGGLCIILRQPVSLNQVMNVKSAEAPATVTWMPIRVRRCLPLPDKTFEVGCQFVRTPPWAVLLTFG